MAKMINIVPEKLENELKIRHLSNGDVSESLGHGRNYMTDAYRRKRINISSAKLLRMLYNIDPKAYTAVEEKASNVIEPDDEPIAIDYNKLESAIYRAVYNAVKKAWSE